jgi:hypothetical protein
MCYRVHLAMSRIRTHNVKLFKVHFQMSIAVISQCLVILIRFSQYFRYVMVVSVALLDVPNTRKVMAFYTGMF